VPAIGEVSIDEETYTALYPLLSSDDEADRERAYRQLQEQVERQPESLIHAANEIPAVAIPALTARIMPRYSESASRRVVTSLRRYSSAAPGEWDCSSTGNGLAPARHGPGVTVDICAAAPSPATKPFWGTDENVLKQKAAHTAGINKRGSDHVGPHPQRDLQAIPQGRASRHGE
jgi:hypothetical protein